MNYWKVGYWTSSLQKAGLSPPTVYYGGESLQTKVVGVTYEGRQAVVARLQIGEEILLQREPANLYDSNAIRVEKLNGEQIGYINRETAAELSPFFDALGQSVKGIVSKLTGKNRRGYSLGAAITFTIPDVEIEEKGGERNGDIDLDF